MSAFLPLPTDEVPSALDALRDRRLPRSRHVRSREQRLLDQMRDNPRVAYRQQHGVLPAWMELHHARLVPGTGDSRPTALPPSPRALSHRRAREGEGPGLALCCYVLAAALGAFAHHVLSPLL